MSQCCVIPHTGDIPTCPMNDQVLKSIGIITVESLVRPEVCCPNLITSATLRIVTPSMSRRWVIT